MLKYTLSIFAVILLLITNKTPMREISSNFGFGNSPIYDTTAINLCQYLPGEIFTTGLNGGFVLSQLYPKKRVSIDTWAEPHGPKIYDWTDWSAMNPSVLLKFYKIAVIPISDTKTIKEFKKCPNWGARYMDYGSVVFIAGYKEKCQFLRDGNKLTGIYKELYNITKKEVES